MCKEFIIADTEVKGVLRKTRQDEKQPFLQIKQKQKKLDSIG
jgi:hypothetical protein